jgi:hypothetical protein
MKPRLTSPQATQRTLLIQRVTTKSGDTLLDTNHFVPKGLE